MSWQACTSIVTHRATQVSHTSCGRYSKLHALQKWSSIACSCLAAQRPGLLHATTRAPSQSCGWPPTRASLSTCSAARQVKTVHLQAHRATLCAHCVTLQCTCTHARIPPEQARLPSAGASPDSAHTHTAAEGGCSREAMSVQRHGTRMAHSVRHSLSPAPRLVNVPNAAPIAAAAMQSIHLGSQSRPASRLVGAHSAVNCQLKVQLRSQ